MVRAALHSRAQPLRTRNHSRFPFTHVMATHAECLTLMPGLLVPRRSRAPGRHLWFTDVTLGGPFATPRARITVAYLRMSFVHSNRSGLRMILSAVSGNETSSLRSSVRKERQPRLHRADASPKAFGASVGTVPPAHEMGSRTPA